MASLLRGGDGMVTVKTDYGTYSASLAVFESEFGEFFEPMPPNALTVNYEQGKGGQFICVNPNSVPTFIKIASPWPFGERVFDSIQGLMRAQALRGLATTGVPQSITRRQLLIALMMQGLITSDEAVAAATTGALPAIVSTYIANMQEPDATIAKITWASMSVCERNNSLLLAMAQMNNLNSDQLDQYFIAASKL